MSLYIYPTTAEQPDAVLQRLGTFWDEVFDDRGFVRDLAATAMAVAAKLDKSIVDLGKIVGRHTMPVLRHEAWVPFLLRRSEFMEAQAGVYLYATDRQYDGSRTYDGHESLSYYLIQLPESYVGVSQVLSSIDDPITTWVAGLDCWIPKAGILAVRHDPFTAGLGFEIQDVYDSNGLVVDREVVLWLYDVSSDHRDIDRQLGYVLGLSRPSTQSYLDSLNAIFDAYTSGPMEVYSRRLWSAIADIPVVVENGEVVESVFSNDGHRWVATDRHLYRFASPALVTVSAGQTLNSGDTMTEGLRFYTWGDGRVPSSLDELTIPPRLLGCPVQSGLTFVNLSLSTTIETGEDGLKRLSFPVGGDPDDVLIFWDEVHRRGVAEGRRLVQLLDSRVDQQGEPPDRALPSVINPLEFVLTNLLRGNFSAVRLQTDEFGPDHLSMQLGSLAARITPSQTFVFVLLDVFGAAEVIAPIGRGNATSAGYNETLSASYNVEISEVVTPDDVQETTRAGNDTEICS